MGHATLWRVLLAAVMMQVTVVVTGRLIPLKLNTTMTKPLTTQSTETTGAPRFTNSNKMKQTFIAWPARQSVRLKCEAFGSWPLTYQWFKEGVPSIRRRLQPRLKTNMSYLRLKDLVVVDSGKYTCVVSNAYGSINHTYTLRVVEKSRTRPILKCGSPKNVSVTLGENATMVCVVILSGTLPDFRWLKWNGIPGTYPGPLDLKNGSFTLVDPLQYQTVPVKGKYVVQVTIANVTEEDLGLYTCYVSNHLGSDYSSAFLSAREDFRHASTEVLSASTSREHQSTTSTILSKAIKDVKAKGSSTPVTSRKPEVPLGVFIGVLGTWTVVTVLALLWCHLYHRNMSEKNLE